MSSVLQLFLNMFYVAVIAIALLACCSGKGESKIQTHACSPPRGWNSYDSYSWIISEQEFIENAQLVANNLLPYGYEYVVIDFLWYRTRLPGATISSAGFDVIDTWGRTIPDPQRWPSTAGGKGFKPIADKVHAMGLKLGIHVMRGISTEAVKSNTPVLGAERWRAADIALQIQACSWMSSCFVSVNESTEGGRAFIQSLYDLYASWEVDFIKHDCVFGADDLSVHEITAVSKAITETGRPMVYSISPGVRAIPSMAMLVNGFVNMYRVTSDDWDSWNDVQLHFDVARDFAAAGLIGAQGLNGLSWPDLDMLPLGYLTDPGANEGPHRFSRLSLDEQRTQVTLWAMAKSPLMFGGDMRNLDQETLALLTNREVLNINAYSFGNRELLGSGSSHANLPVLSVTSCTNANFTRWKIRSNLTHNCHQLCWSSFPGTKGSIEVHADPAGCLNWNPSVFVPKPLSELRTRRARSGQTRNLGYGYIPISPNEKMCLDYEADRMSSFEWFRSKHIVPCSFQASQTWELNHEGKLVNAGYCAVVSQFGAEGSEKIQGGLEQINFRIWIARGQLGEYYVAFFNLGTKSTTISIPLASAIQGSAKAPQDVLDYGRGWNNYVCTGKDVWNSRDLGSVRLLLSAQVSGHGCVLFSLQCKH